MNKNARRGGYEVLSLYKTKNAWYYGFSMGTVMCIAMVIVNSSTDSIFKYEVKFGTTTGNALFVK